MNSWVEQYDQKVRDAFTSLTVELEESFFSGITSYKNEEIFLNELRRMRTFIELNTKIIPSIDPIMVHPNHIEELHRLIVGAQQNIKQFLRNVNVTHLQNINYALVQLHYILLPLHRVKGYESDHELTIHSIAAEDIENRYKKLLETVNELKIETESMVSRVSDNVELSDGLCKNIQDFSKELFDDDVSIKKQIYRFLKDAKEEASEIKEYHQNLLQGPSNAPGIKQQIDSAKQTIDDNLSQAQEKLRNASEKIGVLEEFYTRVYGSPDDEASQGLSRYLEIKTAELEKYEADQKEKNQSLQDDIRSLIDDATNAGLAGAYSDMKKSFRWPIIGYQVIFYLSISALLLVSYFFLMPPRILPSAQVTAPNQPIGSVSVPLKIEASKKLNKASTIQDYLDSYLSRISIIGALIWLAYFASRRLSENRRLKQEYAHKEAVAKSYLSFKKQIQELGYEDTTLLEDLMRAAIEAISHNASETLDKDHGEKHPIMKSIEDIRKFVLSKDK